MISSSEIENSEFRLPEVHLVSWFRFIEIDSQNQWVHDTSRAARHSWDLSKMLKIEFDLFQTSRSFPDVCVFTGPQPNRTDARLFKRCHGEAVYAASSCVFTRPLSLSTADWKVKCCTLLYDRVFTVKLYCKKTAALKPLTSLFQVLKKQFVMLKICH